jgi:alkylated DNA repair protein alkB family protein 1
MVRLLFTSQGESAQTFIGVPRILESSLPNYLKAGAEDEGNWDLIASYMETTRININVRQVFPPGFPYEQYGLSSPKNTNF